MVYIREADLQSIDLKLKSISSEKISELREQGEWLYDKYLSSNKKIIETMLTEMNDRIYAYKAKTYFEWNLPSARIKRNPLFLSRIAQKSQGFTAIILTYDRVESLFKLIQKLSVVTSLQKILVVWNNEKEAPPPCEYQSSDDSLNVSPLIGFCFFYSVLIPEDLQAIESDPNESEQAIK